ncbi:ATP-binding protein, partial [Streptomyces anulatus]|nr:ATP-binding protein [Streptomyces anulatus]
LAATRDKHETAAAATTWNWWAVSLLLVVGVLTTLWTFGFLILVLLWFFTPLALLLLAPRAAPWFRNLRYCLLATGHGLAWVLQRIELGLHAARWGQTLQEEGVRPVVAQLINHMLGDDPDSLFIPDGHDGLRTPRAQYYMVETAAAYQLKRKLTHLRDGTIAVCGPRGAGKTTLLEARVEAADFGLIAQAPATYTPQDFLLMLAVKLCRRYIEDKDTKSLSSPGSHRFGASLDGLSGGCVGCSGGARTPCPPAAFWFWDSPVRCVRSTVSTPQQ